MTGSYLDTQPWWGFDGAGVLAGLEVVALNDAHIRTGKIVIWTDEEGCRFTTKTDAVFAGLPGQMCSTALI